jgi:hypothetical protein
MAALFVETSRIDNRCNGWGRIAEATEADAGAAHPYQRKKCIECLRELVLYQLQFALAL